jgi:hypothetical protein
MAGGRPVVQIVPAARAYAVVFTLVALVGFALTVAFASDRLAVIITWVPMAAFYGGGMILILPRVSKRIVPPPERINPGQLPRSVGVWKATAPYVVLVIIMVAVFVVWSLAMHEYAPIGVLLGGPIISWHEVRRAKRSEHENHGVLWMTTGFAWTSRSRTRYLVAKSGIQEAG